VKNKIVILTRALPMHGLGGMEIVVWDLACELVRKGFPVTIITTRIPNHSGVFDQDGVRVIPLENVPSGRYSRSWWIKSRLYFERHFAKSAVSVLSVSAGGFGLLKLKHQYPHIPFVMQAHGTSWGEFESKWRTRRLRSLVSSVRNITWLPRDLLAYRYFDAVVAVGERVYAEVLRPPVSWSLPSENVYLITNGIDTSLFKPSTNGRHQRRQVFGIEDDTPVVVSASRLHAQKGVDHCLKTFAQLVAKLPGALYLIAGDGPELSRLESLSKRLGLTKSVRFIGKLDRRELSGCLQAADAFLFLTDRVEVGLPLNVLEALASGLPTIISDHLSSFQSPLLHHVSPNKTLIISSLLESILTKTKIERASGLPENYELHYSADQYIDLIDSLSHQKTE